MICPPPIEDTEDNIICNKDCGKCEESQECEFKELKRLFDLIPKYVGI